MKIVLIISVMLPLFAGCVVAPVPAADEGRAAAMTDASPGTPALEANLTSGCVEGYDPSVDYFPQKVSPDFAEGWSVAYYKHYKLLTLHNPWRGAEQTFEYLLV